MIVPLWIEEWRTAALLMAKGVENGGALARDVNGGALARDVANGSTMT